MAIDLTNTAEGGTTGTTVSAGNSGGASGDALTPSIPSGAVVQFLAAAANRGTLGYALTQVANAAAYLQWQPSGQAAPAAAARCYFKPPAGNPAGNEPLLVLRGSGLAADLNLSTAGQFYVRNAAGATLTTFPTPFSASTYYRLEIRAVKGTSSGDGQIAAAVYIGDSATPVDAAYSATNVNAGTTDIGTLRVGRGSSNGATYGPAHFDGLAFSTGRSSFIGPALGAPPVATVTTSAGTIIAATNTLGGPGSTGSSITYQITQTSGPAQAPVQISPGVWFVTPDASTARVYTVTVSQQDGQSDEQEVTVAPASAAAAGPRIVRRRLT